MYRPYKPCFGKLFSIGPIVCQGDFQNSFKPLWKIVALISSVIRHYTSDGFKTLTASLDYLETNWFTANLLTGEIAVSLDNW